MRHGARRLRKHTGEARDHHAIRHAIRRLGERYQVHVTEAGYWELVGCLRMPQVPEHYARFIHAQTQRRHWYLLKVQGVWTLAVWDTAVQRINTFLDLREALACIGKRLEDVA